MIRQALISLMAIAFFTILCGVFYPLVVTTIATTTFPHRAEGSLRTIAGRTVGSEFIAQEFVSQCYFHPRPSAVQYHPLPSGATNFGPTNRRRFEVVALRSTEFIRNNGLPQDTRVPPDMLCASGSGIDPHISLSSAALQCERVAQARGLDQQQRENLRSLIARVAESPFGLHPEGGYVNVLLLNLALTEGALDLTTNPESR